MYLDDLLSAMESLRRAGARIQTVYAPVGRREIQEALGLKPSPVRLFTLLGGLTGLASGLGLAVFAGLQWRFITGGKPVVSWIPFMIVGFEFTILFGILGNLIGMLLKARIPRVRLPDHYDPRFTEDRFGLVVSCPEDRREEITGIMRDSGAEEVREIGGRGR
jgi:molybdopterin-containing oxidoreductase family membrane subunit